MSMLTTRVTDQDRSSMLLVWAASETQLPHVIRTFKLRRIAIFRHLKPQDREGSKPRVTARER